LQIAKLTHLLKVLEVILSLIHHMTILEILVTSRDKRSRAITLTSQVMASHSFSDPWMERE